MESPHPLISQNALLAMTGFIVRLLPDDNSGIICNRGVKCVDLQELSELIYALTREWLTENELSVRLIPNGGGFVYWGTKKRGFAILPIRKDNYLKSTFKN